MHHYCPVHQTQCGKLSAVGTDLIWFPKCNLVKTCPTDNTTN